MDMTQAEMLADAQRRTEYRARSMEFANDFQRPKKDYAAQFLPSPIDLPERRCGKLRIEHRTLTESVDVVGMRQALMRGVRPVKGKLSEPLRIHYLLDQDHGVWMTDQPEELNQIAESLYHYPPRGLVLVGGLGLGVAAKCIGDFPDVECVDVVERSREVITLCADHAAYNVKRSDIVKYLRTTRKRYDYFFLDTWQATGECEWWSSVMPMRRIIRNRWGATPVVHCWAEDIMVGQVYQSAMLGAGYHWHYKCLPLGADHALVRRFISDVGLPSWEKEFGAGVDAMLREEKAKRKIRIVKKN